MPFLPSAIYAQQSQGCDGAYTFFDGVSQDGHLVFSQGNVYYVPRLDTITLSVSPIPYHCGSPFISTIIYEGDTLSGVFNKFPAKEGKYVILGYSIGVGSFEFDITVRLESALNVESIGDEAPKPPFPNPFSDYLQIPVYSNSNFNQIRIYNSNGQIVMSKNLTSSSGNLFNLSQLERGVYYVEVKNLSGSATNKVIKDK